jgi:hypothetical protein
MVSVTRGVEDQDSFEEIFGPIKRIGAANNAFRQCRMPGDDYYSPSMEATPQMFGARLYTTGFHSAKSDGSDVDDWQAMAEAVTFARALALVLKGVMISSDTDCPYYPFVFPKKLNGLAIAKHVHAGLYCKTKSFRDFTVEKVKNPERFFWDEDEEAEDYYSAKEIVRCKKAAALLKALTSPMKVTMPESFVNYPVFFGGLTESGLFTGVCGIRCDT